MEIVKTDIAIVGAGGAGLRAAIALAEADPKLRIALISKVYPMRSHTCAAEGGAAGVIKSDDSMALHFGDTVGGGDWLSDQDAVEYFIQEAPKELTQLEHWGCPWSREPDGSVAVRPFGGMKIKRTWFAADKSGFHILHTLFQTSLKYPSIQRFDEYYATDLLVEDGRCQGLTALEIRSGQMKQFQAKAVIIAAGGGGKMFPFTTNGNIKTGDGMALAYRAGTPLKDMEFVQYHPTGLPNNGILLTEGCRGEGGVLFNKHGRRYLQDYGMGPETPIGQPVLKTMELGPRDRLSQAFWGEQKKGNTVSTPWGDCVLLDMRHLGEKKIDERLPLVRDLCISYLGKDPVKEPIPIRPVVHYMMGGIHTDVKAATRLPGLFAAGECACVSINGANRLGSNSLTELLVFGKRAALSAIEHIQSGLPASKDAALAAQAQAAEARIEALMKKTNGTETIAGLRKEMMETMETNVGIYRTGSELATACDKISELRQRYANIALHDKTHVYNTDLMQALELKSMLDCAEAVTVGARDRKESRGAHQRLDFTERDDVNLLKHTLTHYHPTDPPRIEYLDVVITQSQPGVRDYSGAKKMSERQIQLEVLRYNPETDSEPRYQTYSVPCLNEWVVLDALNYVKDNLDPTLSYRWSCHMAVCGSCGMMINGEPKLACKAFIHEYTDQIRVDPMANFPIERDLVTSVEDFIAKLASVKPYLIPKEDKPISAGEFKQTPAELKKFKQYTLCINCMLCYAACPQYGLVPEFLGPAAISMAHRYNQDSRDGGRDQRQEVIATDTGVWECSFVGACSEVCPKHVDPAGALQQVKVASTIDWYKEHLMPWMKK